MEAFVKLFSDYGLLGLIIGSMIFLIFTFILVVERRDKRHNQMIEGLLSEAKDERMIMGERFAQSTDNLEDALKDLAKELRYRE